MVNRFIVTGKLSPDYNYKKKLFKKTGKKLNKD